jgi:uncharacterized membrane protein (DUF2068 family)
MNLPAPNSSSERPKLLPGMAVIALWMLLLSVLGLVGVATHSLPRMALLMCVGFGAAGAGLMRLQRWGWALALAAAFLSVCYGVYVLLRFHQGPMIGMIVVNLIFFLYLVRSQVIDRLR